MQNLMQSRPKTRETQAALLRSRQQGSFAARVPKLLPSVFLLLVVFSTLGGRNLRAQTRAAQSINPAQQPKAAAKPTQPRGSTAAYAEPALSQHGPAPEPSATFQPTSPAQIWPVNQTLTQAKVSWDGRDLEIEAFNSSLDQILHQVAADTGARLEGFTQDQRIFGSYGPGPGCDVLSQLLEGSGYNVLMVGSHDTNAPLEIVLSARLPASPHTSTNTQNRTNNEVGDLREPEPQPVIAPEGQPQPVPNPFGNGEPPRDPMQFMQEILERQQHIDQQQQNQQNTPQP